MSMSMSIYGLYQIHSVWLKEISYRPGWSFRLEEPWGSNASMGGAVLYVDAHVPDTKPPHDQIFISHSFLLPPPGLLDQRESFIDWVLQCCDLVDRHERYEFFKVNGERWRNPHRDNNTKLYE